MSYFFYMKILALHGNSGSKSDFFDLRECSPSLEIIPLSLPLHSGGRSLQTIDLPNLSRWFLKEKKVHLRDHEPFIVLGHSLGGNIAYHALSSQEFNPRLLVTIGAPPLSEFPRLGDMFRPNPLSQIFAEKIENLELLDQAADLNGLEGKSREVFIDGHRAVHKRFKPDFQKSIFEKNFLNERELLNNRGITTLFIRGVDDPFIEENYLREVTLDNPNFHYIELINSGHYPHLQRPLKLKFILEEIIKALNEEEFTHREINF